MKRSSIQGLSVRSLVVFSLVAATVTGCQNMNNTQKGAGLGAGLGAIVGAIVGHQTGNRDKGAAIGALLGGTGGALAGHSQDMADERDAAMEYAHHESQMRQAERHALSNADVVNMVQNSVPETNIVAAIRDNGGKFDLRPDDLITLSKSGVPSRIIEIMRQNNYTP